jgi:hypothetical protein
MDSIEKNRTSIASVFEDMSNELWMEIFDFLDWYSLYLSFQSLNSRFDAVLANYHTICVDLDCIPSNKIISHLGQQLPSLDPHRIMALRSSVNWHTKLILRDDFILHRFINIRSLTLINLEYKTATILYEDRIYHILMNLVYLFSSFVLSNIWSFYLAVYPKLRQCCLPNATFSSNIKHLQSNTVQYLQISHSQSEIDVVATGLLVHSPHLRRLNLHIALNRRDNQNAPLFVRPSSLPSSTLKHLTVQCSLLFFSSIEWLLTYAPRLRILHVQATSSCKRIIDPNEWEQVLPLSIKQLDVKIKLKEPATLPQEIVKNNDFWQTQKWQVTSTADPSPSIRYWNSTD